MVVQAKAESAEAAFRVYRNLFKSKSRPILTHRFEPTRAFHISAENDVTTGRLVGALRGRWNSHQVATIFMYHFGKMFVPTKNVPHAQLCKTSVAQVFSDMSFNHEEVEEHLKMLNVFSSASPDKVHSRNLREISLELPNRSTKLPSMLLPGCIPGFLGTSNQPYFQDRRPPTSGWL